MLSTNKLIIGAEKTVVRIYYIIDMASIWILVIPIHSVHVRKGGISELKIPRSALVQKH